MKKYDLKTAYDYINGNDIKDYTLEELEDDKDFMMMVLKITKDKKMYYFCSNRLKEDYDFIKFVIYEFKDDIDFICEIADNFLKSQNDIKITLELNIIISNLLKSRDDYRFITYELKAGANYILELNAIEDYKEKSNDKYNIGKGFLIVYNEYEDSKMILDYFANKMIMELFENDVNLEKFIHENYNAEKTLKNIGSTNFVINLISYYDAILGDYAALNVNLISDCIKKVNRIQANFENYNKRHMKEKVDMVFEKIDNYFRENEDFYYFGERFTTYYVAKKMGLLNYIVKYGLVDEQEVNTILNYYSEEDIKRILDSNFKERIKLKNVENIFSDVFFNEKIEDDYIIEKPEDQILFDFDSGKRK